MVEFHLFLNPHNILVSSEGYCQERAFPIFRGGGEGGWSGALGGSLPLLLTACAVRIKHFLAQRQRQDPQCSVTGGERALCWGEHRKGLVGEIFPFSCLFSSTGSALQEQLLAGTSPDPWPGLTAAELLTLLAGDTWSPPKTQLLNGSSSCLLGFRQLFHLHNPLFCHSW